MPRRTLPGRRLLLAAALAVAGCSSTTVDVGFYGGVGYVDDPWYWGGCCIDAPDGIGPAPPRPAHPIANTPPVRPSQPIANPPRPMPAPRPAAMPRGRR